jgi:O-phosphoseryl-tRNA(Cys) synthetase
LGKAIVITRKAFAPKGQYFHFKGDGWVKEVSDIPVQVFGHWKPRLLTEYKLPEDIANLSVVVTERLA